MAYTTAAIVRVESPFNDSALIDDTYVNRSIAQADNYIDGYIAESYTLPLASTPAIIQHLSTTLTIVYLFTDQNVNIEVGNGIDVGQMMDDVNATLESIRNRKIKLIATDGTELATSDRWKPSFYPTTALTNDGTTPIKFKMEQQF